MRAYRGGQIALGLGIWVWMAGLVLAPGILFPVGRYVCHQRPARSFFIDGQQMPVCARCTGLYAGAAVAAPAALIVAASMASRRARMVLTIAALPTLITWTLEFAGIATFSNISRFVAALPLGFTGAWLVLGVLREKPPAPSP